MQESHIRCTTTGSVSTAGMYVWGKAEIVESRFWHSLNYTHFQAPPRRDQRHLPAAGRVLLPVLHGRHLLRHGPHVRIHRRIPHGKEDL